jgi:hypothetical protein
VPALEPSPGETIAIALARELQLDPDLLLAMAGKVSSELQTIICKRPRLFADLISALKDQPDHAVLPDCSGGPRWQVVTAASLSTQRQKGSLKSVCARELKYRGLILLGQRSRNSCALCRQQIRNPVLPLSNFRILSAGDC